MERRGESHSDIGQESQIDRPTPALSACSSYGSPHFRK